jgi:polar amino acid transport system substrate-binding protein
MQNKQKIFPIALLSFILGCSQIFAAKPLKVLAGMSLAPYVIPENHSGIEVEIIRAALGQQALGVEFQYVSATRLRLGIETRKADGAMTVNEEAKLPCTYSQSHITYQNVAITLQKNNLKIQSTEDLRQGLVLAWQDAKVYSGEAYLKAVNQNPNYAEIAIQESQVKMLFAGRADVIIIDRNIFAYYFKKHQAQWKHLQVTVHPIFPPMHYKTCWLDPKIAQSFDKGLESIKKKGLYQKILDRYTLVHKI